jgi:2-iminobutanoate/2-iminopropanoate deaminase
MGDIMKRKTYASKNAVSIGPYSHAVESNDFVFLSGQTPINPSTGEITSQDISEQTRQAFSNLFNVLEATGLNSDHVVKVNVFLTDMKNFQKMNEVYEAQFKEPYPARTTIGVKELPLGALIEIEMIASTK